MSNTDSADETESVEMSTDLPLASSVDGSGTPSTSSSSVAELGITSFDNEDWADADDTGTDGAVGVVVDGAVVVERISELLETSGGKDED